MTHYQNYYENVSEYVLMKIFKEIQQFTNLNLINLNPFNIVNTYKLLYNIPKIPKVLISNQANKKILPKIIIVGPQKTGSWALWNFLKIDKKFGTNNYTQHYEEVQFFSNNKLYFQGNEKYVSYFKNLSSDIIYEKSSTYFDNLDAIKRIKSMIPNCLIVIILRNPINRGYSYYHHIKRHVKSIPSFDYFLNQDHTNFIKNIAHKKIYNKIFKTGCYYKYIIKWIENFSFNQIYFIFYNQLKNNPIQVLQNFTKYAKNHFNNKYNTSSQKQVNYRKYLRNRYNPATNGIVHNWGDFLSRRN
ncbi:hypothetical protein A3Q56_03311 [Intoshia linei]|uniref:Sulfotransferase domain-containing protein n=1 Tax=Intoshia linei TaxID=1819745 RepID=A0A177B5P3_9BILA|nr:hypothetical protein A3Q56_03311 [Intoshia linei]